MKKRVKKLSLNRETIHSLEPAAIKVVLGGDSEDCVTADCRFSWWSCSLSGCAASCTYND